MLIQYLTWAVALAATYVSVLALPPTVERSISNSARAEIFGKSPPGPEVEWGQFFAYPYGFCRLSAGWEMFELGVCAGLEQELVGVHERGRRLVSFLGCSLGGGVARHSAVLMTLCTVNARFAHGAAATAEVRVSRTHRSRTISPVSRGLRLHRLSGIVPRGDDVAFCGEKGSFGGKGSLGGQGQCFDRFRGQFVSAGRRRNQARPFNF